MVENLKFLVAKIHIVASILCTFTLTPVHPQFLTFREVRKESRFT